MASCRLLFPALQFPSYQHQTSFLIQTKARLKRAAARAAPVQSLLISGQLPPSSHCCDGSNILNSHFSLLSLITFSVAGPEPIYSRVTSHRCGAGGRVTRWMNGVSEKLVPVSPTECRPDILFTVAGQLYNLHILWFMAPPSQFYGSHPQTTDNWGQFFVMGAESILGLYNY